MARPTHPRRIGCRFGGRGLRPIGRPGWSVDSVTLGMDELEAIRLADLEGLYQDAAAQLMGISRPTFGRILARARAKVARALLEELALVIEAGPVVEDEAAASLPCPVHEGDVRRGRGCRCRRADGGGNDDS